MLQSGITRLLKDLKILTTSYTATIQNTFEKMELTHTNNYFYVNVYVSSINSRENRSWYKKLIILF